jgi:hypothetical protein
MRTACNYDPGENNRSFKDNLSFPFSDFCYFYGGMGSLTVCATCGGAGQLAEKYRISNMTIFSAIPFCLTCGSTGRLDRRDSIIWAAYYFFSLMSRNLLSTILAAHLISFSSLNANIGTKFVWIHSCSVYPRL